MLALRVFISLAVTRYINSVLKFPQQHNVKPEVVFGQKFLTAVYLIYVQNIIAKYYIRLNHTSQALEVT